MSRVPETFVPPAKRWGHVGPTDAEHAALVQQIVDKQKAQDEADCAAHQVGVQKAKYGSTDPA